MHGVLFVPDEQVRAVANKLRELRGSDTETRIHHREIRNASGSRYRIAERWLEWFKAEGLARCSFKVFAVDQEGFRQFPYPGDEGYAEHLLKNTVTSFVAGIQWSLPRTNAILLRVICDASENPAFLWAVDRFASRIKSDMIARRARQRRRSAKKPASGRPRLAPLVRVQGPRLIPSKPLLEAEDADERELLQLTDLILGVLWDAVGARTQPTRAQSGRLTLAKGFLETLDPAVPLPWAHRLAGGRALSVSVYPDERGRAYTVRSSRERLGQSRLDLVDVEVRKRRNHSQIFADVSRDHADLAWELGAGPAGEAVTEHHAPAHQRERRQRSSTTISSAM